MTKHSPSPYTRWSNLGGPTEAKYNKCLGTILTALFMAYYRLQKPEGLSSAEWWEGGGRDPHVYNTRVIIPGQSIPQ